MTRLMDSVAEVISDVSRYAGDTSEDDDPPDDAGQTGAQETADASGADLGQQPPRNSCWRRVLREGQELRRALRCFTDILEEKPSDGWYPDDVPF